jgi:hypothetical protein
MSNNKIVDISILEQSRNQVNEFFCCSSMDDREVVINSEELKRLVKKEDTLILKYNKEKEKLDQVSKNSPSYQKTLQRIKQIRAQGKIIVEKRIAMYEKNLAAIKAKETDRKIINKKVGELLKISITSLHSPFCD